MCDFCRIAKAMGAISVLPDFNATIDKAVPTVTALGEYLLERGRDSEKVPTVTMLRERCGDNPVMLFASICVIRLQLAVWRRALEATKAAMLQQASDYADSPGPATAEEAARIDAVMQGMQALMGDEEEEAAGGGNIPPGLAQAMIEAIREGNVHVFRMGAPPSGPQGPQGN